MMQFYLICLCLFCPILLLLVIRSCSELSGPALTPCNHKKPATLWILRPTHFHLFRIFRMLNLVQEAALCRVRPVNLAQYCLQACSSPGFQVGIFPSSKGRHQGSNLGPRACRACALHPLSYSPSVLHPIRHSALAHCSHRNTQSPPEGAL